MWWSCCINKSGIICSALICVRWALIWSKMVSVLEAGTGRQTCRHRQAGTSVTGSDCWKPHPACCLKLYQVVNEGCTRTPHWSLSTGYHEIAHRSRSFAHWYSCLIAESCFSLHITVTSFQLDSKSGSLCAEYISKASK